MQSSMPRIGVIGTGAIGGFYGLMLARSGQDVHFLLRSEYQAVLDKGLTVDSWVHGMLNLNPVQAYRDVADMPACDWLLVGAKSTTNAELAPIIAKAAAPGAKVVLLQNGLDNEADLRPLLPDDLHLIAGLCYVCLYRTAPGVVVHQDNGLIDLAYHSGPAGDDTARAAVLSEGAELFRQAGIKAREAANLESARWQKLVWNAAFNGVSVLLNGGTKALLDNPASWQLIRDLMAEIVSAAEAQGYSMPEQYPEKLLKHTHTMPDYQPSMYHDWLHKRPMELDNLYGKALEKAAQAGCAMPKTEALLQMLRFIQDRYLAAD
ncbi:putative 2-dehydropantoate 2-reductase [Halopseudomonas phragmitis]|uniref:2-dehydropantoate 2-reductase n=2 Tax=Pseudomonadaceae TaxID=135621 RepID=A0A1V0B660_9GAMM|nr:MULTISPECIES: putative 2-dehydropantoate 2-reductase [Pseudomonadaceae]AQZ95418.1 2-dehydropantoate 2-reductase [Halopseudomonas phragmitis]RHW22470.1 putative 2-dehydropantoate 2-reductase [Pseudomonas jilinensis]